MITKGRIRLSQATCARILMKSRSIIKAKRFYHLNKLALSDVHRRTEVAAGGSPHGGAPLRPRPHLRRIGVLRVNVAPPAGAAARSRAAARARSSRTIAPRDLATAHELHIALRGRQGCDSRPTAGSTCWNRKKRSSPYIGSRIRWCNFHSSSRPWLKTHVFTGNR